MPLLSRWYAVGALALAASFAHAHLHSSLESLLGQRAQNAWSENVGFRPTTLEARENVVGLREFRVFRLDERRLRSQLAGAPMESERTSIHSSATIVSLPMPGGRFERFRVVESPILSPELQASRPEIRTYLIQGLIDRTATGRIGVTPRGFHGIVLFPDRSVVISRADQSSSDYIVNYRHMFDQSVAPSFCQVIKHPDHVDEPLGEDEVTIAQTGPFLRTYRTIISATGELTRQFGGIPQMEARIVELLNPTNAIYERDFTTRFNLVAFNIFDNPSNDPFRNGSGVNGNLLDDNINSLNSRFGSGAYDVGHVLCPGGGGVAFLAATCQSFKAGGVTGASGLNNTYHIGVLSHEFGHQYAANHSFNSLISPCGENRNAGTAYEPGSGSTIMAYPGLCGNDNVVGNFDLYFHTHSHREARSWVSGRGGSCAPETPTGNNAPVVSAGADFTIPRETPYILTAFGSDQDEQDVLTYVWEQYDLGTTDSTRPLVRSIPPTTNPVRFVPNLPAVIGNRTERWEALPIVNRTMRFRATVRDNRAGSGGVAVDEMRITVSGDPFRVSSPNGGESWEGGSRRTVTWTVGGGSVAPLVDILLSTDGGESFGNGTSIVLAGAVPNDGSESVTIPNIPTTRARIIVRPVNNIFYDMSNANFTITETEETAFVTSYSATRGTETTTNDPNNLRDDDDILATIRQQFPASPVLPNAELTAVIQGATGSIRSAELRVRHRSNARPFNDPSARLEIYVRDWTDNGRPVLVDTRPPSDEEEDVLIFVEADLLTRFIRSDGRMEVLVRAYHSAPVSPGWTMSVDMIRLLIRR